MTTDCILLHIAHPRKGNLLGWRYQCCQGLLMGGRFEYNGMALRNFGRRRGNCSIPGWGDGSLTWHISLTSLIVHTQKKVNFTVSKWWKINLIICLKQTNKVAKYNQNPFISCHCTTTTIDWKTAFFVVCCFSRHFSHITARVNFCTHRFHSFIQNPQRLSISLRIKLKS